MPADPNGQGRGNTVGLKEDHGAPGALLLPEAFGNHDGSLFADAANLAQALRMLGEDHKGFFPEGFNNQLGSGRTHTVDQAAAEETLNTQKGCGRFQFAGDTVKLAAVGTVIRPVA